MAKDWIMVRLLETTHAALERTRVSMQTADLMGMITLSRDTRGRVSLDQVITRLIAMRDAHHRRARKQRERGRPHVPILPDVPPATADDQCRPLDAAAVPGLGS